MSTEFPSLSERDAPDVDAPLYWRIARSLEADIHAHFSAGDWLPSELELATRFGVNRHTLRRAIDDLVAAGLVERRAGKGVYVLNAYLDYTISRGTRFTETVQALGHTSETDLLFTRQLPASRRIAQHLSLAEGAPVIWIESLRTSDEIPLCLISHYLPADLFTGLPVSYTGGSLHQFLVSEYACQLRRTESLITAVMPMGQDSRHLLTPRNRPLLRVKSVNVCTVRQRPVEYSITRFRSDRIQLRINP